ncbi:MAG: hypothetical protein J0L64_02530 [Acidobacteria bacterium]|nr:hypothetical protein [Acidobacteriota bacterium]
MTRLSLASPAALCTLCAFLTLLTACGAGNSPWPATAPPQPAAQTAEITTTAITETAPAASGQLHLTVRGAECEARLGPERAPVQLGLTGPCAIMRDHKGSAQTYRYDDAGGVQVYVIVGEMKGECGTSAQALLVRGTEMKASTLIQRGSHKCPKVGLDEKDYWMFAHK